MYERENNKESKTKDENEDIKPIKINDVNKNENKQKLE